MRTARDLFQELYYWIHIGTADDIVNCPDNRPEYQPLVGKMKRAGIKADEIPQFILTVFMLEMLRPAIFQPTFWRLLWIDFKKWGRK